MSLKKIATKKVITISPEATVQEAAMKMRDHHVGDLVVVKTEGQQSKPVGILTDRDIVMSTTAFGVVPSSVSVGDIMAPTLAEARTTDSLYHVLNLMKENGIKRVPLVSSSGVLEGIVSSEDIIAALASDLMDLTKTTERQYRVETERRKKIA